MRKTHLLLLFLTLFVSQEVRADIQANITLNTESLIGDPAGPFYINFQFNDGAGSGDANNSVTLSNFRFGPDAGPVGTPLFLIGGATGDLNSRVTLIDSSFVNAFVQQFQPGLFFSFLLHMTTNVDPGPIPDNFSFAILDNTFTELPTTGFFDSFVAVNINSSNPALYTFASDRTRLPAGGGNLLTIPPPQATVVPEPSTPTLLAVAVCFVLHRRYTHGSKQF